MKRYILIVQIICLLGFSNTVFADVLQIDKEQSKVGFIGSKIGFMDVYGVFGEYSGSVSIDNDEITQIEGVIEADSVDSKSQKRDENIKGKNLLESKKYPQIKFTMTKYEKINDTQGKVYGSLQMHGVTQDIQLDSILNKQEKAYILTLTGKTNIKKDFKMESYSMMSNDVRIDVSLYLRVQDDAESTESKAQEDNLTESTQESVQPESTQPQDQESTLKDPQEETTQLDKQTQQD